MDPANDSISSVTATSPQQPTGFVPPPDNDASPPVPFGAIPSFPPIQSAPVPSPLDTQTSGQPAEPVGDKPVSEVVTQDSNSGKKKKIMAALGIVVMLFGIGAGVYAFRNYQAGRASAWDCTLYVSSLNENGTLTVTNGSTRKEPGAVATISLNGSVVTTVNVPALVPGQSETLETGLTLPTNESYSWLVEIAECKSSDVHEVSAETAQCVNILAYDESWEQITAADLTLLETGDVVRFTVRGAASAGTFEKDRFSINGATPVEVT